MTHVDKENRNFQFPFPHTSYYDNFRTLFMSTCYTFYVYHAIMPVIAAWVGKLFEHSTS